MTFLAPTPEQTATHSKPQIVSILSAPSKGNGYVAKFTACVNDKLATYLIQFDALPPSEMDYVEEGWEELEEGGTFIGWEAYEYKLEWKHLDPAQVAECCRAWFEDGAERVERKHRRNGSKSRIIR